jgi:arsenite methyltransferase
MPNETLTPVAGARASGCCGTPLPEATAVGTASPEEAYALRPAVPADLAAVRALLERRGLPAEGIADHLGPAYAVAVDGDGAVVGVAGLETYGAAGLLRSLAVDAAWAGRGIGAALTTDRLAEAAARGLTEVYGLTTTAEDYFPRFGFEAVTREAVPEAVRGSGEFADLCPESAAVLRLNLRGPAAGDAVRAAVRARYGAAARSAAAGGASTSGPLCCDAPNPITSNLYDADAAASLPEAALRASLGCGNPTALAELRPGEVVLDLGSGGGIDVLLSARRVGPTGKAYGVDMTDEMLALARRNAREAGVENVEFLKGHIEDIPLPDASVDVILSNCVINLSADKPRVLREAFRVLKPGGRFAVSDVVVRGEVPAGLRRSMELWVGCVAGALEEGEFARLLAEVGFEAVSIEPTRIYRAADARALLGEGGVDAREAEALDGRFASAFVRGVKPPEAGAQA